MTQNPLDTLNYSSCTWWLLRAFLLPDKPEEYRDSGISKSADRVFESLVSLSLWKRPRSLSLCRLIKGSLIEPFLSSFFHFSFSVFCDFIHRTVMRLGGELRVNGGE